MLKKSRKMKKELVHKMNIAVFGSTGFVGNYLIECLVKENYKVRTLIRKQSISKLNSFDNVKTIEGHINDNSSVEKTIDESELIIYNIGIIREFRRKNITYENLHYQAFKNVIDIAKKKSIRKIILMSANGSKNNGTAYQTTKWRAEQELVNSGLEYTIFKPSLIFGKPMHESQPEFCTQLKRDMISLPLPAPLFHEGILPLNAGNFQLTPIHVKNVSEFFVKAIRKNECANQIYELGGTKSYTWREIIKLISSACNKTKLMIPAPVSVVKLIASIFEGIESFPITKDQLTMLMEGNVVNQEYFKEFDIVPIEFNKDSLNYLNR